MLHNMEARNFQSFLGPIEVLDFRVLRSWVYGFGAKLVGGFCFL